MSFNIVRLTARRKNRTDGFTLVELLITIAIIAILSSYVMSAVRRGRESAFEARAFKELRSINQSLELYLNDYGAYPADTNRDIPPGLEAYLGPGIWPDAAWPGSVFDWDNWADPDNPGERIYQISIRFCPIGQPSQCRFPNEDYAQNFDISSSVYYCLQGACRAHIGKPINHPGYCINC